MTIITEIKNSQSVCDHKSEKPQDVLRLVEVCGSCGESFLLLDRNQLLSENKELKQENTKLKEDNDALLSVCHGMELECARSMMELENMTNTVRLSLETMISNHKRHVEKEWKSIEQLRLKIEGGKGDRRHNGK